MELTAGSRYAVVALLEIAANGASPVSARWISKKYTIPINCMEKCLIRLKNGGLLDSHRGAHGGYTLKRLASEINLNMIFSLMEEPFGVTACQNGKTKKAPTVEKNAISLAGTSEDLCQHLPSCEVRYLWQDFCLSFSISPGWRP